tara:strand:- start:151 stop:441 length:291 start_codon:yes stop_codon:yes gene_type:complete
MSQLSDFTIEEKTRMIEHMNDDHSDACLLYVQHYGEHIDAVSAKMINITRVQMDIEAVRSDGEVFGYTYKFEAPLKSVEHAAKHLAEMAYSVTDNK